MKQCELNKKAEFYLDEYTQIKLQSSPFEPKGIFHSELLMAFTIAKELGVEKIIESGRARGQSTEIVARFCKKHDIEFHSIEYDRNSPDVVVAEKRLEQFKDVCTLHYGDGFEVMPTLLDDKRILIIIDGPKGVWAQKLGMAMLGYKNVKAVLFHDTHRDGYEVRNNLERYFKGKLLFSDDYEYVEKYQSLDDDCWRVTNHYIVGYGPYKRPGKMMRSYAGTFTCIINEVSEEAIAKYTEIVTRQIKMRSRILYRILYKMGLIDRIRKMAINILEH